MKENLPLDKPLPGLLWLGTAGVALLIVGLSAILAANWHWVPLPVQIGIALLPLVAAWSLYLWMTLHRRARQVALEEVLGILWAGGVLCSIALLGRVLQLSSSSFAFFATMAGLLLPVTVAVRSTAAWLGCLIFGIAAALTFPDLRLWENPRYRYLVSAAILGLTALLVWVPAMIRVWHAPGLYARGQRWFGAGSALALSATLADSLQGCVNGTTDPDTYLWSALTIPMALPLMAGSWLERGRDPLLDRPLSLLGGLMLGGFFLIDLGAGISFKVSISPWECGALFLIIAALRRLLYREGLLLAFLPLAVLASVLKLPLLATASALAIGGLMLLSGIRNHQRMTANEGLLFTLVSAWIGFAAHSDNLTLHGVLFVCCGVILLAFNLCGFVRSRKEAA